MVTVCVTFLSPWASWPALHPRNLRTASNPYGNIDTKQQYAMRSLVHYYEVPQQQQPKLQQNRRMSREHRTQTHHEPRDHVELLHGVEQVHQHQHQGHPEPSHGDKDKPLSYWLLFVPRTGTHDTNKTKNIGYLKRK